jgi:hypothetical protein
VTTTITPTVVGSGAPAVDCAVVWNVGGVTQVTIERSVVTGVWVPLRFGNPATLAAGSVTIRDYEVPDNVAATYRTYPAGAPSSAVTGGPVTVPERTPYLIHPAFPDTLSVSFLPMEWPKWSRPVRQETTTILGVAAPVVVTDVRSTRQGTLGIVIRSAAEEVALNTLLDSTRVLFLNANRYPSAGGVWVAVGDEDWTALEVKIGATTVPFWRVDLPLQEIDRPATLSSGEVTWLDVSARYATFDLLAAAYTTFDAFWVDAATWTS